MSTKRYLGDSVYAEHDGYGITLTTENGAGPSNTIYLEPQVFHALTDWLNHLRAERVEQAGGGPEE